ncbi:MAG TPA: FAD-binding protein, partial [Candidatus Saccharimonadia bacterium]
KHITIGGAIVGIGIETNSFRKGFVHDNVLEAEVLLPDGEVVTCNAHQHAALFHGLPNSYGTLGYILRATIKLHAVKPYAILTTKRYTTVPTFIAAMGKAAKNTAIDYLESLAYAKDELYLTTIQHSDHPQNLISIYGSTIFYKRISRPGTLSLTTRDYLFRYDPEWFWAMPDSGIFKLFRRLAPPSLRNSSFYARYANFQGRLAARLPFIPGENPSMELLIQDWEVPWKHAADLLAYAFDNLDLAGRPLMSAPVKTPGLATSYPMQKNQFYLNLGSYSYVKKQPGKPTYHNTKMMDAFTFAHAGLKMLYSTTMLPEADFNRIYNGPSYKKVKAKYDPQQLLPTLYEKTVKAY